MEGVTLSLISPFSPLTTSGGVRSSDEAFTLGMLYFLTQVQEMMLKVWEHYREAEQELHEKVERDHEVRSLKEERRQAEYRYHYLHTPV